MFNQKDAKHIEKRTSKSGSTYSVYYFDCSICGSDIKMQSHVLKTHSGKCRKCTQRGRPFEHILNELIYTCNRRNKYLVTLTYEEFISIIDEPFCHYCSKELAYNPHTRDDNSNYTSRAYQLDRKDNKLGYDLDNVVTCCWECNRLKSDIYTYDEFMLLSPILKEIQNKRI